MEDQNQIPFDSFEFGKANNRHKIYYKTTGELIEKIEKLKALGLVDDSIKLDIANYKSKYAQD